MWRKSSGGDRCIGLVYRRQLLVVLILLYYAFVPVTGSDSCPSLCNCKWKSGKKSVECSDKSLITIPEGIDPETQLLDMSGNNLQTLPRETFVRADLLDLQKVYLRDCQIGQIDDRALQGLSNVVDLDLSHNLLTSIPSSIFEDVPNLRNLSLARNPIKKIDASAFRFVSGLIKLDLSHCHIAIIATHAFDGIASLELLRLNGNKLAELRLDTVDPLNGLHGIELHDNPWHCDCGLRALKLWLTGKNIPYPIEPICLTGPVRVANKTFNQLQANDFACRPEMKIKPDHRYVESAVGENATVLCRVESVPRANISWYWNGRLLLNNTAFSPHQRIFIHENSGGAGEHGERRSALTLTNTQDADSSQQFYCVAENSAGIAEANFTLRVVHRLTGFLFLGNAQMTMVSAALIAFICLVLVFIAYLVLCIRKMPPHARTLKHATAGDDVVANGGVPHGLHADAKSMAFEPALGIRAKMATSPYDAVAASHAYTAQTLPRPNGTAYTAAFDGPLPYPRHKETSNPDLIADASQKAGEYTRGPNHHDLFYPPPASLWTRNESSSLYRGAANPLSGTGSDYRDTNDKTPIIEEVSFYESQQHHQQQQPPQQQQQPLQQPPSHTSRQPISRFPPEYGKFSTAAAATAASAATLSSPVESTAHPNAKTIRVWQKGVQVLPPVTALKRVLNRNSPDEGYQEGCGTDV